MINSKISVIIPIYNVENYLEKCITSVVDQSYRDLEIILVDDGSPDGCPAICDKWKEKDDRIHVIHKANGGLSDARNAGIKYASGRYMVFVDSDDWIAPDMVEKLYHALADNNADLSICGIMMTDGKRENPYPSFDQDCVISREEAFEELVLDKRITSHAWNKLYKREIFDHIEFPVGRLYEDVRIMHEIFDACDRIAVVHDALYFYYRRDNAISGLSRIFNKYESSTAFYDRYLYVRDRYPQYAERVLFQSAKYGYLMLVKAHYSDEDIEKNQHIIRELLAFLKRQDVKKAIKKYGSKSDYIYYKMAVVLSVHSHVFYKLLLERFTTHYNKWN